MAKPRRIGEPAVPDISGPIRALPWADVALCAQTDGDLWFPKDGARYVAKADGTRESMAKSICRRCPALVDCRDYAMAHPELEGIWGGTTERERRQMRKGTA